MTPSEPPYATVLRIVQFADGGDWGFVASQCGTHRGYPDPWQAMAALMRHGTTGADCVDSDDVHDRVYAERRASFWVVAP